MKQGTYQTCIRLFSQCMILRSILERSLAFAICVYALVCILEIRGESALPLIAGWNQLWVGVPMLSISVTYRTCLNE